jgi:hypothetical protein
MKLPGHVERMGESSGVYRDLVGILRDRHHLEHPSVVWKITLRWLFRKGDVGVWTRSI